MIQEVNGADWMPDMAHNATVDGTAAILDAGGAVGGLWAWAEYTAPLTPNYTPTEVNLYLADLVGHYWIGVYNWQTDRWDYSGPFTDLSVTVPTTSAFWVVHVYGSDRVTVLSSAFECEPV